MKTISSLISFILGAIGLFLALLLTSLLTKDLKPPKIILPEQYKMIDSTTAIIGHFNSKGELVIEFDNRIQFEWEGLTRDIPEDGIRELQLTTNENTVYLNPVDE